MSHSTASIEVVATEAPLRFSSSMLPYNRSNRTSALTTIHQSTIAISQASPDNSSDDAKTHNAEPPKKNQASYQCSVKTNIYVS